MISIALRDMNQNEWFRHRTKVTNVIKKTENAKYDYAGCVPSIAGCRWNNKTIRWRPQEGNRVEVD